MGWDFLKLERPRIIIFGLGVFLYLLFIFQKTSWLGDEGMVLSSALRVAQGEVMYRDFFEFWTPGIVYLGALIIKIFGLHLIYFRLFFLFNLFLIIFLVYKITEILMPKAGFLKFIPPIYFLLSLSGGAFIFYHQWVSLFLTALFAILFFKLPEKNWKYFILGLIAATAFLFTQTQGIALNFAFLGSLFFIHKRDFLKLKKILLFLLGEATLLLPVFIYFSVQAGFFVFIYDIAGFILTTYSEHYRQINPSYIWPIALIFYVWFGFKFKKELKENSKILFTFLAGFTLLLIYSKAPIRSHTYLGFIFTAPLIFYALAKIWPQFKLISLPFDAISFGPRAAVIFSLFLFYLLFFDSAFFVIPDQIQRFRELKSPIQSRAGTLYTTEWQADRTNYIIDFLNQNTSPGEYIYVGPYSSQFYVLANIKNPTRYSQLTPKYNPPWMFEQTVSDLKSKNPRFIILLTSETPFKFEEDNPLSLFVLENYVVLKKLSQGAAYRSTNRPENAIFVRKDLAGEFGVDESQNIVQ